MFQGLGGGKSKDGPCWLPRILIIAVVLIVLLVLLLTLMTVACNGYTYEANHRHDDDCQNIRDDSGNIVRALLKCCCG